MAELEGLMNDLIWARQTKKMPLMVEGDSQIIINNGSQTIAKNPYVPNFQKLAMGEQVTGPKAYP